MVGYVNARDKHERFVNSFATQSFRDQADRDYILARLACKQELYPQYLWSAQQAIEKYLKSILLYNRIPAKKIGHELDRALALCEKLPFKIDLSESSRRYIAHLANVGKFRYLEVPYSIHGYPLLDLDRTVWELRRYCQIFKVFWLPPSSPNQAVADKAWKDVTESSVGAPHLFRINGGLLEGVMKKKDHPSRPALIWQNPMYAGRARKMIRAQWRLNAQNPVLYLYPEMLDDIEKLVFMPDSLVKAYRVHLQEIKIDPGKRP